MGVGVEVCVCGWVGGRVRACVRACVRVHLARCYCHVHLGQVTGLL